MQPITDIASAIKVLNERKWRGRAGWEQFQTPFGGVLLPPVNMRVEDCIAIANSLIAEKRIADLEAKLDATCPWRYDDLDDYYATACGQVFQMENNESLEANGFRFCYHCGKAITIHTATDSQSQSQRS